ncbi:MAG: hypothetical protein KAU46_02240 [Candidatus Aminicenantes bacterium]|nr:hypothetical protein [Candidatus Aminicenantes bacterium]
MMKFLKCAGFILILVSFLVAPVNAAETPKVSAGYHDYESFTRSIKQIAAKNKRITKLESIGKTLKGRDIWMLQISGVKGPKPEVKQALLICGNLEGDHVVGSEVALGIAEFLVSQYGKETKVTQMLDKRTFYIVPRLNPDGAELFFKKVLNEHSGNLKPRDEDYDWLLDEDGPDDLNGDGMITLMRVKDKEGEWIIDRKDPRLMKKKEAGTPDTELYKIHPEGIDNDGDELFNEDGPGGFNINRNFPHNFGYKPKGLGVYAASERETQALIDFTSKYITKLKTQPHRNICGILVFSKYDNLAAGSGIESGTPTFPEPPRVEGAAAPAMMSFRMGRRGMPATPQAPPRDPQPKSTNSRDKSLFDTVSKKYKDVTGIKSALSEKPAGSLLEWGYFQFGVPTFSANLWSLREDAPIKPPAKIKRGAQTKPAQTGAARARQTGTMDRSAMMQQFMTARSRTTRADSGSSDEKWLNWIDKKNKGKGFVKWTKFNHKQLGEVEIGGFQPYLRVNPPADQIQALSKSHAEFALYLASQFAEIEMGKPEVKKMSSNLFELKIKIHNRGKFPFMTAMGQRTRNISSIMVRLKFDDDKKMKLFGGSKRYDLSTLEPGAEKEYKWVIISPPGKKIDITLQARSGGGTTKKQVVLR